MRIDVIHLVLVAGDYLHLIGILSLLLVFLQLDADGFGVAVRTTIEVIILTVLKMLAGG